MTPTVALSQARAKMLSICIMYWTFVLIKWMNYQVCRAVSWLLTMAENLAEEEKIKYLTNYNDERPSILTAYTVLVKAPQKI